MKCPECGNPWVPPVSIRKHGMCRSCWLKGQEDDNATDSA